MEEIKLFVENNNQWFELDDESDTFLQYITRQHGDVGNEKPGQEDINRAITIGKKIVQKFPNVVLDIDTCDEWVYLKISKRGI